MKKENYKTILIVILVGLFTIGFAFLVQEAIENSPKKKIKINEIPRVVNMTVMTIDSCEYIVCDTYNTGGGVAIIHKQNCKKTHY